MSPHPTQELAYALLRCQDFEPSVDIRAAAGPVTQYWLTVDLFYYSTERSPSPCASSVIAATRVGRPSFDVGAVLLPLTLLNLRPESIIFRCTRGMWYPYKNSCTGNDSPWSQVSSLRLKHGELRGSWPGAGAQEHSDHRCRDRVGLHRRRMISCLAGLLQRPAHLRSPACACCCGV